MLSFVCVFLFTFLMLGLPSFLAGQGLGIIVGLVIGCFIPAILRKVKSWIVAESVIAKKKF